MCTMYNHCTLYSHSLYITLQIRNEGTDLLEDLEFVQGGPKVRAYCSASDHLIRKTFFGVCRDIHWFEEYLKIIEIDDHFFE